MDNKGNMTTVLHIIKGLSLGGAARALITCANRCAKTGGSDHTIVSLLPSTSEALQLASSAGLSIVNAPDHPTLIDTIRNHDIVHVHFWNSPMMYELLRSDLPPVRLLIMFDIGGMFPPQVITLDLVEFADRLQTTGPFAHDLPVFAELTEEKRLTKVRMIIPAADFSRIEGLRPKPHDGFNVTYIGTVSFSKMHPEFVSFCSEVGVDDARFIVCGPGDAARAIQRQAVGLCIQDRFDFRKETEDIRSILAMTDVFGYPLCQDNYASGELILQEVAYAGIPAVILNTGGAARLVVDNFTGYVAHSRAEYAKAIKHLYYHPEERERLGNNAREYARQIYGDKNAARATNEIYEDMMNLPKRHRVFGVPQGSGYATRPVKLIGAILREERREGAYYFTKSLGDTSPQFMTSMTSTNVDELLEADRLIAASSPVLTTAGGGIFEYRDYYPDDGYFRLWAGLTLMHRGEYARAVAEFCRSESLGCDHWRVLWYMAKCAARCGHVDIARRALKRVLRENPNFSPAKDILDSFMVDCEAMEPDLELLRLRRDLYRDLKDWEKSEAAALAVLNRFSQDNDDYEAYYQVGLECHKIGLTDRAMPIYANLQNMDGTPAGLKAWAHFKHGEMLKENGQRDEAISHFRQAVAINPNHAKARIFLVDNQNELRVAIGESASGSGLINLPMDPLNEELWEYYFEKRRADFVCISLPAQTVYGNLTRLASLLSDHLAPGGRAELRFDVPCADQDDDFKTAFVKAGFHMVDHNSRIYEMAMRAKGST
jgi:glycosyltransferase involved in cell wall biosynthesis/Flp pilus assembly protein TadD